MRLLKVLSIALAAGALILFAVVLVLQIKNRDHLAPVISISNDVIELSVNDPVGDILKGVTAQDEKDGDVTFSLMVENLSSFVAPGERIATIAAFDQDYHVAKSNLVVRYTDYEKPRFTLTAPLSFVQGTEPTAITSSLTAWDCLDGDVTRRISRAIANEGNPFNSNVEGYYPVTFSVSNSAGDMERFTATVEIYDPTRADLPRIALWESLVYLPVGSAFNPLDFIAQVQVNGSAYQPYEGTLTNVNLIDRGVSLSGDDQYPWEKIQVDSPVDMQTPGWYEVSYTVESAAGTMRTAYLLVCVEE